MEDRNRTPVPPIFWILSVMLLGGLLSMGIPSYRAAHLQNLDLQLLRAANNGYEDEIGPLLDRGARVDARLHGWVGTPLSEALGNGGDETQRLRIVQTLLIRGANPNARDMSGRMPLDWAVVDGNLTLVTTLLAHGADPNLTFINGNALNASLGRSPEMALALLAGGAHVDRLPDQGRQKMFALAEGLGGTPPQRLTLFSSLLAKGAAIDGRDREGKTMLIHAVESAQPGMVKALFAYGVNVNDHDARGDTALTRAMAMGVYNRAIIKTLIDHGADVSYRGADKHWVGALKQAELRNETEIAAWLRKAGAKE